MQVINIHRTRLRPDQYVYIGRPSIWGNLYSHLPGSVLARFRVRSRDEAIRSYEAWIREQPALLAKLPELVAVGFLGCHCKPLPCHGDILIKPIYERRLA